MNTDEHRFAIKTVVLLVSAIIISMVFTPPVHCAFGMRDLEKANALLRKKKFEGAQGKYDEIIINSKDTYCVAAANFNKGIILYLHAKYDEAIESFLKAMAVEDLFIEAKANYNMGNCKYKQSEVYEPSDLRGSIDLCKEALYFYGKAIEANPKDMDARYNYEVCKKRIEELMKKKPYQPTPPRGKPEEEEKEKLKREIKKEKKIPVEEEEEKKKDLAEKRKQLEEQYQRQQEQLNQKQSEETQSLDEKRQKQARSLNEQHKRQQQDLQDKQSTEREKTQTTKQQKDLEKQHTKQQQDLQSEQSKDAQSLDEKRQKQRESMKEKHRGQQKSLQVAQQREKQKLIPEATLEKLETKKKEEEAFEREEMFKPPEVSIPTMSKVEANKILENYSKKQRSYLESKKKRERKYFRAKVLKNW